MRIAFSVRGVGGKLVFFIKMVTNKEKMLSVDFILIFVLPPPPDFIPGYDSDKRQ